MWRQHAFCQHCGRASRWQRERDECRREIVNHLGETHNIAGPREDRDYIFIKERQCDYCLEPYVDHCTKCDRDFCRLHEGDIDGLCGGCI